jgi:hypothetical protein
MPSLERSAKADFTMTCHAGSVEPHPIWPTRSPVSLTLTMVKPGELAASGV